ncbi:DegV family protein [Oscillospiraceae bacterium LTW-04]|nr:DegV family protein [Oscillospiraceae bacterium MB24-C1]
MNDWQLVSDSSCDLNPDNFDTGAIPFSTVPLKILVGDQEFVDLPQTDPHEMLAAMKNFSGASSSACPSPYAFAEQFLKAAHTIAVTITSGLSGSYNCAVQAMNMVLDEHPEKKIHVVDSRSAAGSMVLILRQLKLLIEQGIPFEEIVRQIESYRDSMKILFSLATFDNLVKNGRMSRAAGVLASALNIRAVATNTAEGVIEVIEKPRGEKRAIERMVALMGRYKDMTGKPVVITHCNNPNAVKTMCDLIKSTYGTKDSDITVLECACLTSFYAGDKALLLSF